MDGFLCWDEGWLGVDGFFLVVVEPDLFDDDWARRLVFEGDVELFDVRWDSHTRRGAVVDWWRGRWVHGHGWDDAFPADRRH